MPSLGKRLKSLPLWLALFTLNIYLVFGDLKADFHLKIRQDLRMPFMIDSSIHDRKSVWSTHRVLGT